MTIFSGDNENGTFQTPRSNNAASPSPQEHDFANRDSFNRDRRFAIIVAAVHARTKAFETALEATSKKLTTIDKECLMHNEITTAHLDAMAPLPAKIEHKLNQVRVRARLATKLYNERLECQKSLLEAEVPGEAFDIRNAAYFQDLLEIIEQELVSLGGILAMERLPHQLVAAWSDRCDMDYCWWVVLHYATLGEMRNRGLVEVQYV